MSMPKMRLAWPARGVSVHPRQTSGLRGPTWRVKSRDANGRGFLSIAAAVKRGHVGGTAVEWLESAQNRILVSGLVSRSLAGELRRWVAAS